MASRVQPRGGDTGQSDRSLLTVVPLTCGWCATDTHENCRLELEWYSKVYVCSCKVDGCIAASYEFKVDVLPPVWKLDPALVEKLDVVEK
jgi:hypothetical protein